MSNKKKPIDIDTIMRNNPNVNVSDLARNLELINELQKNGVDMGPNYNLESPFSRPNPHNGSSKPTGSTLYAEPLKI